MIKTNVKNAVILCYPSWHNNKDICDDCGKYCKYCGLEREVVLTGKFDQETGKKTAFRQCRNPNCQGDPDSESGYGGGAYNLRREKCRKTGGAVLPILR